MSKELRVKDVKDARKKLHAATVVSWLGWLGSAFLAPTTAIPSVLLLAFAGLGMATDAQELRLPKTVEYRRFVEIYNHILAEFVKLNKKLEFKSVIEVYAFYCACIHSGIFSQEEPNETIPRSYETGLLGPKALNEHGVCRHIAKMLMDLYESMGFETTVGVCAKYYYEQEFVPAQMYDADMMKAMFEDLKDKIDDPVLKTLSFEDLVVLPPVNVQKKELPLSRRTRTFGNHAITLVNDQDNSYFLDPMEKSFLFPTAKSDKEFTYPNGDRLVLTPRGEIKLSDSVDFREIAKKPVLSEDKTFEQFSLALLKTMSVHKEVSEFHEQILEPLKEADTLYKILSK